MKRVVAILVILALGNCAFSQKHPGITVGITTGAIGFFACEISVEKVGTCAAIGGVTGVALGALTGLLMILAGDKAHQIPPDDEEQPPIQTGTPPPPGLPDGGLGLPQGPPGADAGTVAVPDDAGVAATADAP